jgi:hypothetical protein
MPEMEARPQSKIATMEQTPQAHGGTVEFRGYQKIVGAQQLLSWRSMPVYAKCSPLFRTLHGTRSPRQMPKPRAAKLENATARRRLEVRRKRISRRSRPVSNWATGETSVPARGPHCIAKPEDWLQRFALADDLEPADGKHVLTYWQAIDVARALARGQPGTDDANRPATVGEALHRYGRDLESRGADAQNANRVRKHLTPTLASKPVTLLTMNDLRHWRDGLVSKGVAPATINRTRAGLRAALELAASLDDRITNRNAFRSGLKGLPGGKNARRVVLPDADVLRLVRLSGGSRPRRAGRGSRADWGARLTGRAAHLRRFAS